MAVTQKHVDDHTPMGATLRDGGATFRTWAPSAREVYVITDALAAARQPGWAPAATDSLARRADGSWAGFVPGVANGTPYRYWIVGEGSTGFKRDPYARDLGTVPAFPDCDCLVRPSNDYPWHDDGFRVPAFRDLVVYQLHVGTCYAADAAGHDQRETRRGRFLDLLFRIEYLRDLGVNAVQPLPIQEFPSMFSQGYNGTDYFSPETDYHVGEADELLRYLHEANRLLGQHGRPALSVGDISSATNQLKCVVDLCHLNGMAVIFDVVYNHAGGGFDDHSIYFYDRRPFGSNNESLFFTDEGWAGGLVFAFWNAGVRGFLGDNATFLLDEYHVDGLRYDEVSVIDDFGGWTFAQALSSRVRAAKPEAIQIAEYWKDSRWLAVQPVPTGLGFDAAWSDRLRRSVRAAVGAAAHGASAPVDLDAVAGALFAPPGFSDGWRAVQFLENHDILLLDHADREPRVSRLADEGNPRSWYARSRARVATGLLLSAPGIPMLFMGEEILEDKYWSDNPEAAPGTLVWWDGLDVDAVMRDFLAFAGDLVRTRRSLGALRSDLVNPFHIHNDNRVLAFHRWVEGAGEDVVVVASLSETAYWRYELGFPRPGRWREALNSDYYDMRPNRQMVGNLGAIEATGRPMHGFQCSGTVNIPANGVLIFAME